MMTLCGIRLTIYFLNLGVVCFFPRLLLRSLQLMAVSFPCHLPLLRCATITAKHPYIKLLQWSKYLSTHYSLFLRLRWWGVYFPYNLLVISITIPHWKNDLISRSCEISLLSQLCECHPSWSNNHSLTLHLLLFHISQPELTLLTAW